MAVVHTYALLIHNINIYHTHTYFLSAWVIRKFFYNFFVFNRRGNRCLRNVLVVRVSLEKCISTKFTTNNVHWRPVVVIIICRRVPENSVSSPSSNEYLQNLRGNQSAVNMKDKPNSTRIYDEDGFRRRAACICVRKDSDEVIIIILYIYLSYVLFENIEYRVCIAVLFFIPSIRLNVISNCIVILYCCSSLAITPTFQSICWNCCVCLYTFFFFYFYYYIEKVSFFLDQPGARLRVLCGYHFTTYSPGVVRYILLLSNSINFYGFFVDRFDRCQRIWIRCIRFLLFPVLLQCAVTWDAHLIHNACTRTMCTLPPHTTCQTLAAPTSGYDINGGWWVLRIWLSHPRVSIKQEIFFIRVV